jgi:7-cyano-7-deazaguanine synthase in queuosine biosynthesis
MLNTISISGIDIPVANAPVGICVSGGADSALLLYLLLKNTNSVTHIFTTASNQKARTSAIVSTNVIEKCIQLTGNSNIIHHTNYVDAQNNQVLFSMPKDFFDRKIIQYYYTAVTANPPKNIADTFLTLEDNTQQDARSPNSIRAVVNNNVISPFTNIDKQKIAEMYSDLGLTDTLFSLTRSCEILNTPNFFGHCNKCWWCKERFWGFGRL